MSIQKILTGKMQYRMLTESEATIPPRELAFLPMPREHGVVFHVRSAGAPVTRKSGVVWSGKLALSYVMTPSSSDFRTVNARSKSARNLRRHPTYMANFR